MKVTFPHMGDMYIPLKVLLETAGIECVLPPFCNRRTLELGVMHSPEFACLPFKVMMGDFIQSIERGAQVILMAKGDGQCRLGYYADLQSEILESLGYRVKFLCLDASNMTFSEIIRELGRLAGAKKTPDIFKGILYAGKTVFMVDGLRRLANYTRCRELRKGETDRRMELFYRNVRNAAGYRGVSREIKSARRDLKKIERDSEARPLKIAIVGEIYMAVEHHVNLEIEKKLGNLGVEVDNKLSISHWILEHGIKKLLPVRRQDEALVAGKEFVHTDDIGGHGLHTIGNCILSRKNGFDGVIHIYPFTCMPEIIAQSAFAQLQEKYDIPIMTLIIDEMTGEAGYMTRLEAFVDLLYRRRESGLVGKTVTLPGN